MRYLYLNRHAKSSWSQPYSSDFERPLNKRGDKNALFMAKRFAQEAAVDAVISSPAVRALKTAQYFATALGKPKADIIEKPQIYGASVGDMMEILVGLDDSLESVILFGHNPTLTDLACHLDHNSQDHMVTCARIKLAFDIPSWSAIGPNSGNTIYHDYPRRYPEMENL